MAKEKRYAMGSIVYNRAIKPLRKRQDFILLLLYTLRLIYVNEYVQEGKGEIFLYISKMNRLFYVFDEKIFSIQFPFSAEFDSEGKISLYDRANGIQIDSRINSVLISIFENHSLEDGSFEDFFDRIMNSIEDLTDITSEQLWSVVKHILSYDLGYLRYDYDSIHENGKIHPINHFDISFESAATFKIGVYKKISYAEFRDILDVTTECSYLE